MKRFLILLFILVTVCSYAAMRGGAQYDPDAARRNLSNVVDAMTLTLSGLLTAGEASFGTTGTQFNSAGALVMPNNTAIGMKQAGGDIKTFGYMNPSDQMQFGQSGQTAYFPGSSIIASGNVLIATSTDDGANKLQVNGFTKLGDAATGIKMKVLTGTSGTVGTAATVEHGLTASKIISFSTVVYADANTAFPPGTAVLGGGIYQFETYSGTSDFSVYVAGGGSSVAEKPFVILIWYKE